MYTTDKEAIRSNMIRIYELIAANSPLASVVKSSTFVRMDSEVNHPMFNRVLDYKVSKDIDPAEEMKSIMESYESRGVLGFWLTYSHDSDPAIAEALAANGLVKRGAMSGMSLSLANWSYQSPEISGLEIRLAQSERDFEDFKEVFSGGFGVSDLCYQLFVGDSRHEPSFRFHVAYVNALPACSVMTYLDGDVAGIYAVATLEQRRRMGIGGAAVAHALREAQAMGAKQSILQASPMGKSVYQKLGYKEELLIDLYSR
ncbi:hypothetical protein HMSSN036_30110 [Paenibacillus macerans]|nr:hypothetical protein HMSSN036_30110 [Paenibacillus macerans]